jgi:autotransporter adhesin
LSTINSNAAVLSTSTSTGLSSLSTGLSTTNSSLASLSTGLGDAVQYDDASHTKVTLGGVGSGTPVTLTNVADGVQASDAVNFGQLTSLSTSASTSVSSLSTGLSTTNSNVAVLSTSTSTGLSSLSTGLSTTNSSMASLSTGLGDAVQYDDASHTKVTLGGAGSATPVTLTNVADGVQASDAVNFGQLTSLSTSASTGINTAQSGVTSLSTALSTTNSGVAVLSTSTSTGLSTVQSNVTSLSTGLSTTNSNVAVLSTSTSTGLSSLSTGLSTTNSSLASLSTGLGNAVQYDDASRTKITLGGAGSNTPVTLTNVADGVQASDAVNFGQLSSLSTSTSTGISSVQTGVTSLSTGLSTTTSGLVSLSTSTSTGLSTVQSGMTSLSTGLSTTNSTVASLSTGLTTATSGVTSLSTGIANGTVGLVQQVGGAPGNGVITVGANTGGTSVDFTGTSGARQLTGVAAGTAPTDAVNVSQLQAVASVASDAVLYDSASHNSVTLGGIGASAAVALTNVAAGKISATSTDAINGSQLFALETQISALGSSGLGAQNPPSTGGGSTPLNGVAVNTTSPANATGTEAVAVGGNSTASGSKSVAVGSGASATAPNSVALGAGSIADQPNSVSVGSLGNERTITNVAPGVNPTDAVNMSQLNSVQAGVNDLARQAYSGIAGATALTMIPDVDPGKTLAVGVGSGNYKGYSAVAIGFSARITDNLKVKGGVSTSSSGTVYGAGVGYQW